MSEPLSRSLPQYFQVAPLKEMTTIITSKHDFKLLKAINQIEILTNSNFRQTRQINQSKIDNCNIMRAKMRVTRHNANIKASYCNQKGQALIKIKPRLSWYWMKIDTNKKSNRF